MCRVSHKSVNVCPLLEGLRGRGRGMGKTDFPVPGFVEHELRGVNSAMVNELRDKIPTEPGDVVSPWRLSGGPEIGPCNHAFVSVWFRVEDVVGPHHGYGVGVKIQDVLERGKEQRCCYTLVLIRKDTRCVCDIVREETARNSIPDQFLTPPWSRGGFIQVPQLNW